MENKQNKLVNIIKDLSKLDIEFDKFISKYYYNSQSAILINSTISNSKIKFKLSDILLISALTQSSVILSGSSGSGKTFLAELVASFLFGEKGYARKNVTPDMNEQDFLDIDFGAIKDGKKLKEAITADTLLECPALIIDEANRAPSIIQNRLMQVLENSIDLKSKKIKSGKELQNGQFYHWNVLTLNYGSEYAGTSDVDRALKDRISINIPIDNFPPTLDDQIRMIRKNNNVNIPKVQNHNSSLIFDIFQNLNDVNISLEAEAFILYLSFMSNCIKSPTGSKYGVNFSPQYCKEQDCQYARNPPLNKVCPYTFAPSNRVLRRIVNVSKGFALLKFGKLYNILLEKTKSSEDISNLFVNHNIEVNLEDIMAIAPLVLNSTIPMNAEWVINKFNSNNFIACQNFINIIEEQLQYFMKNILIGLISEKNGNNLSEKDKGLRKKALKDDFHYEGLIKYVITYLN